MGRANDDNLRVEANQFCKSIGSLSEDEATYEWDVEGKGVKDAVVKEHANANTSGESTMRQSRKSRA